MRSYRSLDRQEEQRKTRRIRALIVAFGSLLVVLAALATIWFSWSARNREIAIADAAMARVQAAASARAAPTVLDPEGKGPVEAEPEPSPDGPTVGSLYSNDPIDRELNWAGLEKINPDIGFWLYVPGTAIDYPVMVENYSMDGSEYFYLRHDVYGERVSSGSLFTVSSPGDVIDAHMTIFGHNMGGGREIMFGTLQRYKDRSFCEENPYAYIYYPDHTERWKVWAAGNVRSDDPVYSMPFEAGSSDYGDLLSHIADTASYETGYGRPSNVENTVTLSTCDRGYGGNSGRFTVNLVLDKVQYIS